MHVHVIFDIRNWWKWPYYNWGLRHFNNCLSRTCEYMLHQRYIIEGSTMDLRWNTDDNGSTMNPRWMNDGLIMGQWCINCRSIKGWQWIICGLTMNPPPNNEFARCIMHELQNHELLFSPLLPLLVCISYPLPLLGLYWPPLTTLTFKRQEKDRGRKWVIVYSWHHHCLLHLQLLKTCC